MLTSREFFDFKQLRSSRAFFRKNEAVWTALDHLQDYLASNFLKPWPLSG